MREFGFLLLLSAFVLAKTDRVQEVKRGLEQVVEGETLELPVEVVETIDTFRAYMNGSEYKVNKAVGCIACLGAVDAILGFFYIGLPPNFIKNEIIQLCKLGGVASDVECEGALENYFPEVLYMAENEDLTAGKFCGILVGKDCGDWEEVNDWRIDIPGGKPSVHEPTLPEPGSPTFSILQLSDFHLDLSYTPGSAGANCGQHLCCSSAVGPAQEGQVAAGYWGGGVCDLPLWTYKDMLQQIRERHPDIAYILLTGDYPAHDVWLQGREENLEVTRLGVDAVKEAFPDVQVFPSLGNHESFPCNSFPTVPNLPDEYRPDWLYNTLAELYADWLSPAALEQVRINGRYSERVADNLKVIAINTNMGLRYNFWLNHNVVDPMGELTWLIEELLVAERDGDKVHILGHVPPKDLVGAWAREYARIIERFENTVVNQFFGHTHNDEFFVQYDVETQQRALSFGFVSPSVTTWTDMNPGYRILTLDGSYQGTSWRVLDVETFIFDLAAANEAGPDVKPDYFKLYNTRQDLGMPDLLPRSWDSLAKRLYEDESLWNTYAKYFLKNGSGFVDKEAVLCHMVTQTVLDTTKCDEYFN